MSERGPITVFGSGTAQFGVADLRVSVRHMFDQQSPGAKELAEQLYDHASALIAKDLQVEGWKRACEEAQQQVAALQEKLDRMRAQEHVREPVRLLGPGVVRISESGAMWLLNKRESGWASFGLPIESWDALFRRFNVAVTKHDCDEHGLYWIVTNVAADSQAVAVVRSGR